MQKNKLWYDYWYAPRHFDNILKVSNMGRDDGILLLLHEGSPPTDSLMGIDSC